MERYVIVGSQQQTENVLQEQYSNQQQNKEQQSKQRIQNDHGDRVCSAGVYYT